MTTFDEWFNTMTLEGGTQKAHMRQAWDAALTMLDGDLGCPAEGMQPANPAEFAALWNSKNPERREKLFQILLRQQEDSRRCFEQDHQGAVEQVAKAAEFAARIHLAGTFMSGHLSLDIDELETVRRMLEGTYVPKATPRADVWRVEYLHEDCSQCEGLAEEAIQAVKESGREGGVAAMFHPELGMQHSAAVQKS